MSNPSKARGTAFESLVVGYLRANGFPAAERRALAGNTDKGDVAGIPGVVLECKAERSIDLAGSVDEARLEAANDCAPVFAAVVKRRCRSVAEAYVVMTLEQFADMIRDVA